MRGAVLRRLCREFELTGYRPGKLVAELSYRGRRRLQRKRIRRSYSAVVSPQPGRVRFRSLSIQPPSREVPQELRSAAEVLLSEAEAALRVEFDLLGSGPTALGDPIDWHRDFKSGYRWPLDFYLDLPVTRLDDPSDAKVPWELSRAHQLVVLARAARLTGETRFSEAVANQFESWLDANPPGQGINWVNPMEVAIRAVNWIWTLNTLDEASPIDPVVRDRVVASLTVHGRHIAANLEGSPRLRSNHFLSDILGMLAIGAVIDEDAGIKRGFDRAHRWFEREIRAQVFPDGASFEASVGYHGLALEIFMLARWIANARERPFSAGFDARLRGMVEFSARIRHANGRVPLFGDSDSGRVLPFSSHRLPSHDHLLWFASATLGTPLPAGASGGEETAWTLGVSAWREARARLAGSPDIPAAFESGGIYILTNGGNHLVVRCGDVGQNGNGGHAHNDSLSFEFSRGDQVLVVDPGTYVYTADVDARHKYRSTSAHNTVSVAAAEINPIDRLQPFRMRQEATPRLELWAPRGDPHRLIVSHDGYRRLPQRVVHRREFRLFTDDDRLEMADTLEGEGTVAFVSSIHLAPEWSVELKQNCAICRRDDTQARITITGAIETVRLRSDWVSSSYGSQTPASTIEAAGASELPAMILVTVAFDR